MQNWWRISSNTSPPLKMHKWTILSNTLTTRQAFNQTSYNCLTFLPVYNADDITINKPYTSMNIWQNTWCNVFVNLLIALYILTPHNVTLWSQAQCYSANEGHRHLLSFHHKWKYFTLKSTTRSNYSLTFACILHCSAKHVAAFYSAPSWAL